MAKNIEDMVVPEKRKSIRDIPIPESRKRTERYSTGPFQDVSVPNNVNVSQIPPPPPPPQAPINITRPERSRSRKVIWFSVAVAVLVLVFAGLTFFSGATLAYVPRSAPVSFDNEVHTAHKSGEGNLLYSVVKLSGEKGMTVPSSGESQVSRRSSGTIRVYNENAAPQRLIENTRFESPDGKVYRIQSAITVPAGGTATPGSLEVTVHADEPGEEYNIGLTDFTLPGLAGTASFSAVYGRSVSPMTGGFVGVERVVSEEDRTRARISLEEELAGELLSETLAQVPADFILFPSLSSVDFEELPQSTSPAGGSNVTLNIQGHMSGVIFKKTDLSTYLAGNHISLSMGELVDLEGPDSLDVSFAVSPPTDFLVAEEITFSVSGQTTAVWRTDETMLKADIMGKSKNDIPGILENYPAIISATSTFRPFWVTSFPTNPAGVTIRKIPVQ